MNHIKHSKIVLQNLTFLIIFVMIIIFNLLFKLVIISLNSWSGPWLCCEEKTRSQGWIVLQKRWPRGRCITIINLQNLQKYYFGEFCRFILLVCKLWETLPSATYCLNTYWSHLSPCSYIMCFFKPQGCLCATFVTGMGSHLEIHYLDTFSHAVNIIAE